MATQLQLRRGNTSSTGAFTGAVAEVTIDTDKKTIVVHDGSTAGGFPLALESAVSANATFSQGAYDKANSANVLAQASFNFANTANIKVDSAFAFANIANIKVDAAFAFSNTVNIKVDAAFSFSNTVNIKTDAAFSKANAANVLAQAAFDKANTGLANTGTSVTANGLTQYTFANTTVSTSNTTGAVIVSGGVGVKGSIYADAIYDSGIEVIAFANQAFNLANTANIKIDSGYAFANTVNIKVDSAYAFANVANTIAQAAFNLANTANIKVDSVFTFANTINVKVDSAYAFANVANTIAQASFNLANTSNTTADAAFAKANAANVLAQSAFVRANNSLNVQSGGSVTGDVTVTGNLTIVGQTVYANTSTVVIADNILTLNAAINQASAPTVNAGIEIDRGSSTNVSILWNETSDTWTFTNDGSNYLEIADAARLNSVYDFANTANIKVDSAFAFANIANIKVDAAFTKANAANVLAQAAFDKANTDTTSITATGGVYGNASIVPVFTLIANGRVSTVTNTAIAIDTSAITSGTIADARLPTKGTAGTYANATHVPVITTDAYGRVTGVTNTAISFPTESDTLQTVTTRGSTTANAINITNTTASTSNITGALIVAGGVGVKGNVYADAVYDGGIEVISFANQAFTQANSATVLAQAAFDKANTDVTSISATAGVYGNASHITVTTLTANGRVSSITNTAIAISADAVTSGTLAVARGGTGVTTSTGTGAVVLNTAPTLTSINVTNTTVSTSNITGAITVSGGIGVKGNVSANGIIFDDGTRQTTAASGGATIGDVLALSIALG
jgi:hypothetical protein